MSVYDRWGDVASHKHSPTVQSHIAPSVTKPASSQQETQQVSADQSQAPYTHRNTQRVHTYMMPSSKVSDESPSAYTKANPQAHASNTGLLSAAGR